MPDSVSEILEKSQPAKVFQLNAQVTLPGAQNTVTPLPGIVWNVPVPIIVERVHLGIIQSNAAGLTSVRVPGDFYILNVADVFNSVSNPPDFPPSALIGPEWTYNNGSITFRFGSDETIKDYRGAEIILPAGVYDLGATGYSTWELDDIADFCLQIIYRLQFN